MKVPPCQAMGGFRQGFGQGGVGVDNSSQLPGSQALLHYHCSFANKV